MRGLTIAAALAMAIAVAGGAFGAHGASSEQAADWLRTGSLYLMVHAVAALVLAPRFLRSSRVMLGGALLFAATLFAMALGAPRWLGAITPVGGAAMIGAWLAVAWSAVRR